MSKKEIVLRLLDNVPEYKMGYVIAYLQGITADEAEDDAFCEKLLCDYMSDSDKGQYVTLEEMAELSGVDIDAV